MTPRLEFTIGSQPDKDDLVADLISDDVVWGEINNEQGFLVLEIFANPEGNEWSFPLEPLLELIAAARQRLMELRRSTGSERGAADTS